MENIKLVDTHCHLEMRQFNEDREEVIRRGLAGGLAAMITIGSDMAGHPALLDIAQRHEAVYASVGLHPHDAKDWSVRFEQDIMTWARLPKVVAIGEMGLDYHYDHSPRAKQREVFARQLGIARQVGLPVVIHSREAAEDTMEILRAAGPDAKGVLHCYSGDRAMLKACLDLGYHISIAGPVTFPKSTELREIAALVPDDRLLVETDAPYLTPVPYRGKRNEPAYVRHTAQAVAQARGVRLEDIARVTTLNAARLFNIPTLVPEEDQIAYRIRDSLYLNITNRCTNRCSFCVRNFSDFVKGHHLRLSHEPSAQELISAIGEPTRYSEIVFCGYGEPLIRLDIVKQVASWVKSKGGRVRINTNGHASLIHKRNVVPELTGLVDEYSISLNAQDEATYNRLCLPDRAGAYKAMLEFTREAAKTQAKVQSTIVALKEVDVEQCRAIAESLGATLRVREEDVVG